MYFSCVRFSFFWFGLFCFLIYFNGLYVNVILRTQHFITVYLFTLQVVFVELDASRLLLSCRYITGNITRKCMKFVLGKSKKRKDVLDRRGQVNDTTVC